MSQFVSRGQPTGVNLSPDGIRAPNSHPAKPEVSAYLEPTPGYSSSGTPAFGTRSFNNEYDSGKSRI